MHPDLTQALAPLVGLPLWGPARASNMLSLQFGPAGHSPAARVPNGAAGAYALHVFCAWRLARGGAILAASGDLFTPADPDEDLETFDYDRPGATWWDERLAAYFGGGGAPAVTAADADALGGVRLALDDGAVLELFPNSAPAPHYETEFWRLLRPGRPDPHLVVGTWGVELVSGPADA
jgi:hypothetical protein